LWDRLFGTFREAEDFSPACGYHEDRERRLGEMLLFRDVNRA
jgi:sterol desaturase/sphingolipid hydroxylase (fatty acid hydroxylase superfamily)